MIANQAFPKKWGAFDVADDGLLSLKGQDEFPLYGMSGGLSFEVHRYYLMPDGTIFTQLKKPEPVPRG